MIQFRYQLHDLTSKLCVYHSCFKFNFLIWISSQLHGAVKQSVGRQFEPEYLGTIRPTGRKSNDNEPDDSWQTGEE